ncbi:alpha/beta hydrolase [Pseudomonas sp. P108]|nr:alpha/beta hydrolase [Pseudomonas sp. P108]
MSASTSTASGTSSPAPRPKSKGTRQHYAKLYARPGAMHAVFAQFRSIRQDAIDNAPVLQKHLSMPVLAVGGEKSFGNNEAIVMRNAADNVTEVVIPAAGHWLMEEAPAPTIKAVRDFIAM